MKLKYSPKFKLEVIQYQLSGHSRVEAAKKFNINPSTNVTYRPNPNHKNYHLFFWLLEDGMVGGLWYLGNR